MKNSSNTRIVIGADASKRLQIARKWIEAHARDAEILLIAHSAEAATDLQLAVVSATGARFGVRRFTLNILAARLAQHALARAGTTPASNLSFNAVVARAIHSLQSEKGQLGYFAPVATQPGFPVAMAKTLEELRMNEVPPESLLQLARGGKDVGAIAALVDQELKQSKLNDRALLYRTAIDSISAPENEVYIGRPLLLLDVAVQSRLESKLIAKLAANSPDVFSTVPEGDERTIIVLEQALGMVKEIQSGGIDRETVEITKENESGGIDGQPPAIMNGRRTPRSLSFAKQHLFQSTAPSRTPLDESLSLQSWPGEPRECIEIVRSIQEEAARGVPFDQMAVLLNCPREYRAHLEEAFSRADIPAYFVKGTTAPDPAGRAMLALLSCAADGLSARGFAEYLSLGQVPQPDTISDSESQWVGPGDELVTSQLLGESVEPEAPAPDEVYADPNAVIVIEGALRAPARWERLLVDSAVIGGKDRWVRRLEGLAQELKLRIAETAPEEEAKLESIKTQLRDLEALRAYALPLIGRLAALPTSAIWGEWLAHLRALAVNALRYPEGVLSTLADLEQMARVGPVDLYEIQLVLGPRLHDLAIKPAKHRYAAVFVGPIDSARGLSFKVVFVPGLAEKMFPRKIVEDAILPDAQREQVARGVLTNRRHQLELERLALRIAIGSARERAYLSYPRVDVQQSRPRVPSFYALEALRAAEGALPGFEEIASRAESKTRARLGWPAPERPQAAIDEAEYDLALLAGLIEAETSEATGRAHYLLAANQHLARALRGRSRRWLRRWTPNDGLVDPDELGRESIASHQFSKRSFSATAMQHFASCPYRFFLSAILRLQLRQEPAALESIDPLTRGSLFHETQFVVLTEMKASGLLPLDPASLRTAFQMVDEALDRLAGEYEDRLAPAIPRVWLDGINSIRADLREWLRRMADTEDGWLPDKFELSFGLTEDRGPRDSDPDSVSEPVEVIGDLKLRGSIDLIERHASGKYRVTDHKTGKARAERNTVVGGGKYLQPLLYALAAKKLLTRDVESGRLYYCTADGGYEDRVVPLNQFNLETLNAVLMTIRQGLADAFLPAAPDERACDWCDYLAVCGAFEEMRTRKKPPDRLVQLRGIRKLP